MQINNLRIYLLIKLSIKLFHIHKIEFKELVIKIDLVSFLNHHDSIQVA